MFLHRQALTEQLKETEDPALVLHLTSVLLFQAATHCMLHAPGRCVPQIVGTLTGRISTVRLCFLSVRCSLIEVVYIQFHSGTQNRIILAVGYQILFSLRFISLFKKNYSLFDA